MNQGTLARSAWNSRGWNKAARRLAQVLAEVFGRQADRFPSWLVVCFATGVAAFFALPFDPPAAVIIIAGVIAAIPLKWWRNADWRLFTGTAGLAFVLGFTAAQVRTDMVASPSLAREIGPVIVEGRVDDVRREPARSRLILRDLAIEHLARDATPDGVRISIPTSYGVPRVGDRISILARLSPPRRPEVPGGYQFQRFLYFEKIGATGFSLGRWRAMAPAATTGIAETIWQPLEDLRRNVSDRILEVLPGDAGAVAVALTTGEQSLIPERLQDAYRASGLAHLLSISGVHMSLLAGVAFVFARRCLALSPPIALRFETKKWAAWFAMAVTFFYLTISGMSVPAVRAFMMVTVVLVAVLLDRRALSLRTVSWAAFIVLVVYPEVLFGPSYQMSFMSVIALIALYEHFTARPRWRDASGSWTLGRALAVYFAGLVVTDLVAGSVTSVFAAYHFNNLPIYSLFGNLIAVPITGLWVMPWAVVALVLMPFGLDAWAFTLMGQGVAAVNVIAQTVADWPNARLHVPPMSIVALCGIAIGLLFTFLWNGRARWVGLAVAAVSTAQPWLAMHPDVIVSEGGEVIAVTDDHGRVVLKPGRSDRFIRTVWRDRFGPSEFKWPADGEAEPALGLACDAAGCVVNRANQRLTLAVTPAAAVEDCGRTEMIVAPTFYVPRCKASRIIDRADFFRDGAHTFTLTQQGIEIDTVSARIGDRPWNRWPPPFNNGDRARPNGPEP
ncbi:MAG: ComEC family competence protein [Rhodobacteraceae bacterium]|nr:ComEC family competence protein [Paracoccaceae bacterium]